MALILRINKIAEKLKLFEDELEKKKEVLKSKEEMFCHLNDFSFSHSIASCSLISL